MVHPAHPLGVVLGEVVVDGDDVHALAGERVEVGRQRGDQGLALTGLHLGDVAEVQRGAAHELDVEVALAQHPLGGLAHGGERLRHQVVERLAVGEPLPELVGHAAQLLVGHRDEVVLDRVDGLGDRLQLAQDLALAHAQDLVDERHAELPDGWKWNWVPAARTGPSTIVTVEAPVPTPPRAGRDGGSGGGRPAQDRRTTRGHGSPRGTAGRSWATRSRPPRTRRGVPAGVATAEEERPDRGVEAALHRRVKPGS